MAAPQRSSRSHGTSSRPPHRRSMRPPSRASTTEGLCSPPANPAPRSTPSPIVGIGASAGGLEALEVFLRHMPPANGIAFVIVTHMDPQTTSFLPDLLRRTTRMPVHEATNGQPLRPDEVFVTVPGKYLAVEQATLTVRDMLSAHGIPLPIDAFFCSLAADQQDKAIGIILSGTWTMCCLPTRCPPSS